MAEPENKNPAVYPAEGGSQEVGERMCSLETQLSQLTTLVSSLVENQRELVSSLVEQQGEKVESVSYTHLRAHETDSLSRMPSSA